MGVREESNFSRYYRVEDKCPTFNRFFCDHLRLAFRKQGFRARTIRNYRMDNPYSTFEGRAIMVKDAISHNRMEIEVVIV